jgi:hypothetical protein
MKNGLMRLNFEILSFGLEIGMGALGAFAGYVLAIQYNLNATWCTLGGIAFGIAFKLLFFNTVVNRS